MPTGNFILLKNTFQNEGKDIFRNTKAKRIHYQENFTAINIKVSSVRRKRIAVGNLDQHMGQKLKKIDVVKIKHFLCLNLKAKQFKLYIYKVLI